MQRRLSVVLTLCALCSCQSQFPESENYPGYQTSYKYYIFVKVDIVQESKDCLISLVNVNQSSKLGCDIPETQNRKLRVVSELTRIQQKDFNKCANTCACEMSDF